MSSLKTRDNPLGVTPIDTVNDALAAAKRLAERVEALHDALLGGRPTDQAKSLSGAQLTGAGVLNNVQSFGNEVRSTISEACVALRRIEDALGLTEPQDHRIQQMVAA